MTTVHIVTEYDKYEGDSAPRGVYADLDRAKYEALALLRPYEVDAWGKFGHYQWIGGGDRRTGDQRLTLYRIPGNSLHVIHIYIREVV
jgi:hypothetical protein